MRILEDANQVIIALHWGLLFHQNTRHFLRILDFLFIFAFFDESLVYHLILPKEVAQLTLKGANFFILFSAELGLGLPTSE